MNSILRLYEKIESENQSNDYSYWLTQRSNTQKSYQLQAESFNKILKPDDIVIDYGSGLGLVKNYFSNFNYVDYEPFPQDRTPDFTNANDLLNIYEGKAGGVVCNLVLNVIPDMSERVNIIQNIFKLLKVGGVAYIVTRTPNQVETAKTKIPDKDGYKIKSRDGYTFQKGFTNSELLGYVNSVVSKLKEKYKVTKGLGVSGNASVRIDKVNEINEGMNMKLPYDIIVVYNQDGTKSKKETVKAYSSKQARSYFLKKFPEFNNENLFTVLAQLQSHDPENRWDWK